MILKLNIIQKTSFSITKTHGENITQGNKFVKYPFIYSNENNVLKLGLSFTPTPKSNIPELEADIFDFIRKLRLMYHFCNSTYHSESIVKPTSTFTPKPNENQELEKICKTLMNTEIKMKKRTNSTSSLKKWFELVNKKNN